MPDSGKQKKRKKKSPAQTFAPQPPQAHDYLKVLIERLANTYYDNRVLPNQPPPPRVAVGDEVWDENANMGDRDTWFSGHFLRDVRTGNERAISQDAGSNATHGRHRGRPKGNDPSKQNNFDRVQTALVALANARDAAGQGEIGQILYEVLREKVKIEQGSHSAAAIRQALRDLKANPNCAIAALQPGGDYTRLILCLSQNLQQLLARNPERVVRPGLRPFTQHDWY